MKSIKNSQNLDEAGYITGQTIAVDGGYVAK